MIISSDGGIRIIQIIPADFTDVFNGLAELCWLAAVPDPAKCVPLESLS
jgi:hypothetical protein